MTGGESASILGNSILGYLVGRKAQKRQGEIAERGAALSDPWAPNRGYYQGVLNQIYGMPEDYGTPPPEGEDQNAIKKLMGKFGGGAGGGGILGGLLGGGGGLLTGGILGGLLG